jgi:hypothetical protein
MNCQLIYYASGRPVELGTTLALSRDKVRQSSVKQTPAITFTLSGGFEDALGQCGLKHCGSLLRAEAGPRIV